MDIEKDDDVVTVDSCPNCYYKGRRIGVIIGITVTMLFLSLGYIASQYGVYVDWV